MHLQRKITTMEDTVEDTRATAEKEEIALRERMRRLKEKEDGMKKELNEGRKEAERVLKSEATARIRVDEIEEALRESTVALENARAEVEILRAELAVSYISHSYMVAFLNLKLRISMVWSLTITVVI
jgi:CAP-Gly domain-containing linker protein 1